MGLESATYIGDLVNTNPSGSDFKFEGDNHLRLVKQTIQNTFPGFVGRLNRTITKGSGYTPVLNDSHALITCTAPLTLSLTAAATLGNGWMIPVFASGGDVTIDPNGAETVNGQTTVAIPSGYVGLLFCDGTSFVCAQFPITRASNYGTISGNTTLTVANVGKLWNITASAIVTLPAVSALRVGDSIKFKSTTTGDVTLIRQGSDTIDGLTSYRVPSFSTVEVMAVTTNTYILSIKPEADVGAIRPTGASSAALGWALMDGNNLSRTTFAGLFAVIGTTFGVGDGSTTFGKDARGRAMVAAGTGTSADNGVDADVDLTANELTVPSNTRKWHTGMKVNFVLASGTITGLTSGNDYYIIRISATRVSLASSLINAQNLVEIDFTAKSSPVWSITHTYDAKTLGERGGEESHAIAKAEGHPHRHRGLFSTYDGSAVLGTFGNTHYQGPTAGGSTYSSAYADVDTMAANPIIEDQGGGVAMNVDSPFLTTNYEIKT